MMELVQGIVLGSVLGTLALACLKAAILEEDTCAEDDCDGYHGKDY